MGVRSGQGYGSRKPKRMPCPKCGKRGLTTWKPMPYGPYGCLHRGCQYCHHQETKWLDGMK